MISSVLTRSAMRHALKLARASSTLKEVLAAQVPQKQSDLKALKAEFGSKKIDEVTVDQLIGGARSVKCMLWETSLLDANEGIRTCHLPFWD